jgi:hypothetical protein
LDFNQTLAAFFLKPRRAAAAVARPERLTEGVLIYVAALAAGTLYYTCLPADLPKEFAESLPYLPSEMPGAGFWLKIAALATLFFTVEVGALLGWVRAFRGKARFVGLFSLMCWVHVFYLFMFVGMQLGVWQRNADLSHLAEIAFTLWSLVAATLGVREISGLSTAKAFISIILSSAAVFLLLLGAQSAGLLAQNELKVLLLF